MKINDVDVSTCLKDINGADIKFRDFADEVGTNNYTMAVESLGQGISALSSSVSQCGVEEVQHKLDALALAIKWAKISTKGLDSSVKVLVGASDLWKDMEALATAAKSGDSTNIAKTLSFQHCIYSNNPKAGAHCLPIQPTQMALYLTTFA